MAFKEIYWIEGVIYFLGLDRFRLLFHELKHQFLK